MGTIILMPIIPGDFTSTPPQICVSVKGVAFLKIRKYFIVTTQVESRGKDRQAVQRTVRIASAR
jgi:hypothetical protein